MHEHECFAFFCEDVRTEIGGKTSYMGVLGPQIDIQPKPDDAPPEAIGVLAKLVGVAMIRSRKRENIAFWAELIMENGPENVPKRQESSHVLEVSADKDEYLVQFHAQMPDVPAYPGMKITFNFKADDHCFSTSLTMNGPEGT